MPELPEAIETLVRITLEEDIGDGDRTAALLEAADNTAEVINREEFVLCGTAWFNEVFHQLDPDIYIKWYRSDGDHIQADTVICQLQGNTSTLLTGERSALNLLQTLSSTATITAKYVAAIAHTNCRILDTRKTISGLRLAQKYAVRCGGGTNHRIGLYDAILIKENHITAAGSIHKAVSRARELNPDMFIEVEVENMEEFQQAADAGPDRILLDNFTLDQLKAVCAINNNHRQLEASGNITLKNVVQIAETGVDFISVGSITKNIQAIDLSMHINK